MEERKGPGQDAIQICRTEVLSLLSAGDPCSERDVLAENSARIDAKEHIADVRVERVNVFLQSRTRCERRRVQKSDNRLDRPRVSHRHTVFDLTSEAGVPKHDLVGVLVPFPSRRNARPGAGALKPPVDDARQFELPWLVATQWPVTPEQNDHAIG